MTARPASPPSRIVRCPGCGGASVYSQENPYRPFCSARCKGHDFGAWASESYRVEARPEAAAETDSDPPPNG